MSEDLLKRLNSELALVELKLWAAGEIGLAATTGRDYRARMAAVPAEDNDFCCQEEARLVELAQAANKAVALSQPYAASAVIDFLFAKHKLRLHFRKLMVWNKELPDAAFDAKNVVQQALSVLLKEAGRPGRPDDHLRLVLRVFDTVRPQCLDIWSDSDKRMRLAVERLALSAGQLGVDAAVALVKEGVVPPEFVKELQVNSAEHIAEWLSRFAAAFERVVEKTALDDMACRLECDLLARFEAEGDLTGESLDYQVVKNMVAESQANATVAFDIGKGIIVSGKDVLDVLLETATTDKARRRRRTDALN